MFGALWISIKLESKSAAERQLDCPPRRFDSSEDCLEKELWRLGKRAVGKRNVVGLLGNQ